MNSQFLHRDDAQQLEFDAAITTKTTLPDGRLGVVLESTYFYATGGGQEHDTGKIGDAQVIDVFKDESTGKVIHILDRDLPPGTYRAQIDYDRRLRHMQHHTAQHLLTQCFIALFNYETVSANINGSTPSALDLAINRLLTQSELEQGETLANQVIYEDRPVKVYYVSPSDLNKIPLRRPPSVTENIRIVEIDGFDYSACGGTHCARTGTIGIVKIVKQERINDKTRVHFIAGLQALYTLRNYHETLSNLAMFLSVSIPDVLPSIQRQSDQLQAAQKELQTLRSERIAFEAKDYLEQAEKLADYRLIIAAFDSRPAAELRVLADRLKQAPDTIAVLGNYASPKLSIIVVCTQGVKFQARDLLNRLLTQYGGRGGGDGQIAQGGGTASGEQFQAFKMIARQAIEEIQSA